MLLKYNKNDSGKPWVYVDTNDFRTYSELTNYYRELTNEELVHGLFDSLSKDSEYIVFSTTLVASHNHLLIENSALDKLRHQRPINPVQALIYDGLDVGLLLLSCKKGDNPVIYRMPKRTPTRCNATFVIK